MIGISAATLGPKEHCLLHVFGIFAPEHNIQHFADEFYEFVGLKKTLRILIEILRKFVVKGPVNDKPVY